MNSLARLIALALLAAAHTASIDSTQADFLAWEETFDSDAGFAKSSRFFSDQGGDYLGITSSGIDDDFDGDGVPTIQFTYAAGTTNFDGKFLVGEDLVETDATGGTLPHTLTWLGIDISGLSDLQFLGDFAASTDEFDTFGSFADSIQVEVQIDGSGFQQILRFESNAQFGGDLQSLTGGASLGLTAQQFTSSVAGTGSLLDVRLTLITNDDDEAFAIDNLKISGTVAVPEASQILAMSLVALITGGVWRRRRKALAAVAA